MPFTPVHFGLGGLPGGYTSPWFSFRTFCFANVVIDLEALYRIPFGLYPYHDWMHTFLIGLSVPLLLLFPIGRPFCLWVSRGWNRLSPNTFLARFLIPESIAARPAITGCAIGSLTHIVLDSIMHEDIAPFRPFSDANPLQGLVGVDTLHVLLIGSGLVGLALFVHRTRDHAAP